MQRWQPAQAFSVLNVIILFFIVLNSECVNIQKTDSGLSGIFVLFFSLAIMNQDKSVPTGENHV